jgi:hypothetical protein
MWYIIFKDANNNQVQEFFIDMSAMFAKLNEIKEGLGESAIIHYGKEPTKKQIQQTKGWIS